jgi:hypothetical protein
MTTDELRTRIGAALDRGEQPSYTDIEMLVRADPVLAAVVEVAVRVVVSQARQARLSTLADRFRQTAVVA